VERLRRRRDALAAALGERGLAAVIIGPGPDLRHLLGYGPTAAERPTLLTVPATGDPVLVVPRLEEPRARETADLAGVELRTYGETDDPYAPAVAAVPAQGDVAVGDQLWSLFTLRLQERLPGRVRLPASTVTAPLRARKDADEVAALAAVGAAIDAVHLEVPSLLRAGRREREVAADLAELIRRDHDTVAFVIVAGGPNSASPHHEPGDRILEVGDAVVVDIGGTLDGYHSDMTRTYHLGPPGPEVLEAYAALRAAQQAGIDAVRPGVHAEDVDAAARRVLDDAGLGAAFVHRTGHGIGLEVHEAPWIVAGDRTVLAPGMAFSVEPGYYLTGRTGARIEDIVVVTDDGVRVLNQVTRELLVIS
jgi:Xaa-Pro aminopeptidase